MVREPADFLWAAYNIWKLPGEPKGGNQDGSTDAKIHVRSPELFDELVLADGKKEVWAPRANKITGQWFDQIKSVKDVYRNLLFLKSEDDKVRLGEASPNQGTPGTKADKTRQGEVGLVLVKLSGLLQAERRLRHAESLWPFKRCRFFEARLKLYAKSWRKQGERLPQPALASAPAGFRTGDLTLDMPDVQVLVNQLMQGGISGITGFCFSVQKGKDLSFLRHRVLDRRSTFPNDILREIYAHAGTKRVVSNHAALPEIKFPARSVTAKGTIGAGRLSKINLSSPIPVPSELWCATMELAKNKSPTPTHADTTKGEADLLVIGWLNKVLQALIKECSDFKAQPLKLAPSHGRLCKTSSPIFSARNRKAPIGGPDRASVLRRRYQLRARKLKPGSMRLPVPEEFEGQPRVMALVLHFDCYLRPSEALAVSEDHLIRPAGPKYPRREWMSSVIGFLVSILEHQLFGDSTSTDRSHERRVFYRASGDLLLKIVCSKFELRYGSEEQARCLKQVFAEWANVSECIWFWERRPESRLGGIWSIFYSQGDL
ncbi:unnamed protein product, partial [Symbiodinium sp. CCMP2456]